jgi:hypothetical protein
MTVVHTSKENIQKMSDVTYLNTDNDQGSQQKFMEKNKEIQEEKLIFFESIPKNIRL